MSQYTGSVPDTLRAADWRERALCATSAGRRINWFPNPTNAQGIAKAKALCATCPVWRACLTSALREEGAKHLEHRYGIRGGLSPQQRRNAYERTTKARRRAEASA